MHFETPRDAKPVKLTAGQRRILADKVRLNAAEQIKILRDSIPQRPDLETFLRQAAMSGTLKIKTEAEILAGIKEYASIGNNLAYFHHKIVFEIPEEYKHYESEYNRIYNDIQDKIRQISREKDTICMKIEVGSMEALQMLIKDIDQAGGGDLRLNNNNSSLLLNNGTDDDMQSM